MSGVTPWPNIIVAIQANVFSSAKTHLVLPNFSQRARSNIQRHPIRPSFRSTNSRSLLVLLPLPTESQNSKERGRKAAEAFNQTYHGSRETAGSPASRRPSSSPHVQGSPHTRRSDVEGARRATSWAHVLRVGVADLPGVGGGDELQDGGFDLVLVQSSPQARRGVKGNRVVANRAHVV